MTLEKSDPGLAFRYLDRDVDHGPPPPSQVCFHCSGYSQLLNGPLKNHRQTKTHPKKKKKGILISTQ